MGGGQSSIQQQVIQDPKPVGPDPSTGLSLSTSEGCGKCELVIDGDISSSMVEMARLGDPMTNPSPPISARAFIFPTLPFKAKFNGVQEGFVLMSVYAPSPIRIENVQHDAVLQIGFPGMNKVVILVPLISSNLAAPSVDFMQKVCGTIQTLSGPSSMVDAPGVTDGSKKVYAKIPVSTGSAWKLTDMIGPTDPYFTWVEAEYESYVRSENPSFKVMGWKPKDGVRYIVMQNPAPIAETDLAAIRMLPITKPGDVLTSLGKVFYKSGTPKNCTTCKPVIPTLPAFPDIATSTIAAPSAGTGGSGGISTETILKILGYVVGAVAIGLAIYFGVKYAMDNKWASVLPKIGESIQRQMAKAYAKQQAAVAAMPATIAPDAVPTPTPGPRRFLGRTGRTARAVPGPVAEVAARDPVNLPEPSGQVAGPRRFLGRTGRVIPGPAVALPEPVARPRRFLGRTGRTARAVPGPVAEVAARDPVNLPEPSGQVAGPRRFLGRTGRVIPGPAVALPEPVARPRRFLGRTGRRQTAPANVPGRTKTKPRAMRDVLPGLFAPPPRGRPATAFTDADVADLQSEFEAADQATADRVPPRRLARGTAARALIKRDAVADARAQFDAAQARMGQIRTNLAPAVNSAATARELIAKRRAARGGRARTG